MLTIMLSLKSNSFIFRIMDIHILMLDMDMFMKMGDGFNSKWAAEIVQRLWTVSRQNGLKMAMLIFKTLTQIPKSKEFLLVIEKVRKLGLKMLLYNGSFVYVEL